MNITYKLLLAAFFLILKSAATLQSPVPTTNYTSEILRLAKAAHIKAYMKEDLQPCEKFYKFACGNWKRLHPSKIAKAKTSYLDQLHELYVQKSVDMLKTDTRIGTQAEVLLKSFYTSCQTQSTIESNSILDPILKLVNFNGGWPIITNPSWYENDYDWLRIVAELKRKLGVDILIGLDIIPDYQIANNFKIKVGAPQLELGTRAAYLDEKYTEKREQYKWTIAEKLNRYFSDMDDNWADEVAEEILAVEQQLANGLPYDAALTLQQTTRQRTTDELKSAYGSFVDLSRYLNLIFNTTIYFKVYETPEDYMSNLVDVIQKTPKLSIANYTMWRVLELVDAEFVPKKHQNIDIWCVQKVNEYFPRQLESMFSRKYNNMQMINEVQSTWADVKKVYREELLVSKQLDWLTQDTRQKAVSKLDALELQFQMHNEMQLIEQMQGLRLNPGKYFQNMLNILQWKTKQHLAKLFTSPEPNDSDLKLPKYELTRNRIQIPITFLQARFFWDSAYPNALKYGTIGFLLAQEMLHGFDMIGRRYDGKGYHNNWWDNNSLTAFDEHQKCFERQYGNSKLENKSVQDPNMLSTSIADNGALNIAFRAYQQWWKNAADSEAAAKETLPLLDYTQYQLFFIGFGQLWCADHPEALDQFTELPERLRVEGALSNSNEFSNEYKCADDSKLNPSYKCKIY